MMDSRKFIEMLRYSVSSEQACDPQSAREERVSYPFVVYFGADDRGIKTFSDVIRTLETNNAFNHVIFTFCPSESLAQQMDADNGSVVVFTGFDEGQHELKQGFTEQALYAFLEKYTYPLVMNLGDVSEYSAFDRQIPCLFLFLDGKQQLLNSERTLTERAERGHSRRHWEDSSLAMALLKRSLQLTGAQFRGELQIVMIDDISQSLGAKLAQQMNVTDLDVPVACICDVDAPFHQYRLLEDLSAGGLMKFVQDWSVGALNPWI